MNMIGGKCSMVGLIVLLAVCVYPAYGIPSNSVVRLQDVIPITKGNQIIPQLEKLAIEKGYDMDIVRRYTAKFQALMEDVMTPGFDVGHPINALRYVLNFTTFSRHLFTHELKKPLKLTIGDKEFFNIFSDNKHMFPSQRDREIVIDNIINLQHRYDLSIDDLMAGTIQGHESTKLKVSECLEVAHYLYAKKSYHFGRKWLDGARLKLETDDDGSVTMETFFRIAAQMAHSARSYREAVNLAKDLLATNWVNEGSQRMVEDFERTLENHLESDTEEKQKLVSELEEGQKLQKIGFEYLKDAMCQGESVNDPDAPEVRSCRLVDHGHPFLRLQPIKLEEVLIDPYVVIMHDVFSEQEMASYIKLTKEFENRLREVSFKDNQNQNKSMQSAQLQQDNVLVQKLKKRVEIVTSLNLDTSEPVQVANYGVGGYHLEHFDVDDNAERYATFMAFLSDVDAGGTLSFIHKREFIVPKAGNAVFWYNQYRMGVHREEVIHEVCPVVGSLWTLTVWPNADDQMFNRPCTLDEYE